MRNTVTADERTENERKRNFHIFKFERNSQFVSLINLIENCLKNDRRRKEECNTQNQSRE